MLLSEGVFALAGICSILALSISAVLIWQHQENFTKPVVQAKLVGVLYMVPIYAVDSFLSLRFRGAALYLNLLRDCYEGYALYLFLALLVAYLGDGDEHRVVELLEKCPLRRHSFPFSLFLLGPVPHGRDFLRWAKKGTLQYSVIKPAGALVAILLHPLGRYTEGSFDLTDAWPYLTVVINASVMHAFYCLGMFYVELKGPLAPYDPVPKFLCIKAVLFLSYWQSVVVAGLGKFDWIRAVGSWSREDVETGIQDFLICIEMLVVAVAHTLAFSAAPYMDSSLPRRRHGHGVSPWESHFAHDSAVRDFNEVMPVLLPSNFTPGPARSFVRIPLGERLDMEGVRLGGPEAAGGSGNGCGSRHAAAIAVPAEATPLLSSAWDSEDFAEGACLSGLRVKLLAEQHIGGGGGGNGGAAEDGRRDLVNGDPGRQADISFV